MDINDLRALAAILVTVAFFGICAWAYSSKRRQAFDEAANLPFADEPSDAEAVQTTPGDIAPDNMAGGTPLNRE